MKVYAKLGTADAVRLNHEPGLVGIDISGLDEIQRERLAKHAEQRDGHVELRTSWPDPDVTAPTAEALMAVVAAIEARRERERQEKDRVAAERREKALAVLKERRTRETYYVVRARYGGINVEVERERCCPPDQAGVVTALEPDWPYNAAPEVTDSEEAQEWIAELDAKRDTAIEAERPRAIQRLLEAQEQERKADAALRQWAEQFGDELLKARMAGGYEWKERAREQYADAVLSPVALPADEDDVSSEPTTQPTLDEIRALESVRQALTAQSVAVDLVWVDDNEDEDGGHTDIRCRVTCLDGKVVERNFVAG